MQQSETKQLSQEVIVWGHVADLLTLKANCFATLTVKEWK